jgi:transcriptional regulator with XRE-family HTH domain
MSTTKTGHYIHENLSFLTQSRGLRVADIARATLLPESTIKYILSGTTTNPRIETVSTLASFFGLSLDFFVNTPIAKQGGTPLKKSAQLPLIQWNMALHWVLQQRGLLEPEKPVPIEEWIPVRENIPHGSFVLSVNQQTLEDFPQHALLIVAPQERYFDGDYVLSSFQKNVPTIRQILDEDTILYLKSPRIALPPEPLTPNHTLLGKICECRRVFA